MNEQFPASVVAYLDSISKLDFRTDLGPVRQIATRLNHPELSYPTLHIAGTNGKGSTCAFLESLLREEGLKVGLYTSPHILSICERIQVNREAIPASVFCEMLTNIRTQLPEEVFLSYFEMTTLIAFEYFRQSRVDIAVIETGLGGRLDATNIVQPEVAVLTPISFDHQSILGNTLQDITREKCGIFKKGARVVSSQQSPEVRREIEKQTSNVDWCDPDLLQVPLGLSGKHQKMNAATALKTAEVFLKKSLSQNSLTTTYWPGRLDIVSHSPLILCDGAHNEAGIQSMADHLLETYPDRKKIFAVGVLEEKNWKAMFPLLTPLVDRCYVMPLNTPRGLNPSLLRTYLESLGWVVAGLLEPKTKSKETKKRTGTGHHPWFNVDLKEDEMLIVTGSFYAIEPFYVSNNTTPKAS